MRNLIAAALTLALLGSVATTAQAEDRPSHHDQRHSGHNDGRKDNNHRDGHRDHKHDGRADNRHDNDRHEGRDDRRDDRFDHRHHDHRSKHARHDHDRWDKHGHDRHRYERNWYKHNRPHGYHYRAWRNGDRLPRAYSADRYVVHDYRAYRLRTPPRGFYWVRVDNDVLLTAIATGLVAQAIYGVF